MVEIVLGGLAELFEPTTTHTNKKAEDLFKSSAPSVIRLGLEPRTPALKVLCSTS